MVLKFDYFSETKCLEVFLLLKEKQRPLKSYAPQHTKEISFYLTANENYQFLRVPFCDLEEVIYKTNL